MGGIKISHVRKLMELAEISEDFARAALSEYPKMTTDVANLSGYEGALTWALDNKSRASEFEFKTTGASKKKKKKAVQRKADFRGERGDRGDRFNKGKREEGAAPHRREKDNSTRRPQGEAKGTSNTKKDSGRAPEGRKGKSGNNAPLSKKNTATAKKPKVSELAAADFGGAAALSGVWAKKAADTKEQMDAKKAAEKDAKVAEKALRKAKFAEEKKARVAAKKAEAAAKKAAAATESANSTGNATPVEGVVDSPYPSAAPAVEAAPVEPTKSHRGKKAVAPVAEETSAPVSSVETEVSAEPTVAKTIRTKRRRRNKKDAADAEVAAAVAPVTVVKKKKATLRFGDASKFKSKFGSPRKAPTVSAVVEEVAEAKVVDEPTPVVEKSSPVVEKSTPVVEKSTPVKAVVEESTPVVVEEPKTAIPVVPKAAPVSSVPTPVTAAPVTAAPVTAAPVTAAPVTAAPVTAAPVTAAPVTAAPVTAVPVTAAPVTAVPVTAAPAHVVTPVQQPLQAPVTAIPMQQQQQQQQQHPFMTSALFHQQQQYHQMMMSQSLEQQRAVEASLRQQSELYHQMEQKLNYMKAEMKTMSTTVAMQSSQLNQQEKQISDVHQVTVESQKHAKAQVEKVTKVLSKLTSNGAGVQQVQQQQQPPQQVQQQQQPPQQQPPQQVQQQPPQQLMHSHGQMILSWLQHQHNARMQQQLQPLKQQGVTAPLDSAYPQTHVGQQPPQQPAPAVGGLNGNNSQGQGGQAAVANSWNGSYGAQYYSPPPYLYTGVPQTQQPQQEWSTQQ